MDFEELTKKIEELKAQGLEDEDILDIFYEAFVKQEMGPEDLAKAAGALGYEFSEEFKAELDKENVGENGNGNEEVADGLTKEEVESVQEKKPGESDEEFKDKIEELNEGQDESSEKEEDEKDEKEDDDSEWEEAKKYFKL